MALAKSKSSTMLWNEFQWQNLYLRKYGPPIYQLPTWKETYEARFKSNLFSFRYFLIDMVSFPTYAHFIDLLVHLLTTQNDPTQAMSTFQDAVLILEKNTDVSLSFCVAVLRRHFELVPPIHDVDDELTQVDSLAHIVIVSYFRLHCMQWLTISFESFCMGVLGDLENVTYTVAGRPLSAQVESIKHSLTKFVTALLAAPPLPAGMRTLISFYQQKCDYRVKSYLVSISAKDSHTLHRSIANCLVTADIFLYKVVLEILCDAEGYGFSVPSQAVLHYHRNCRMLQLILKKAITAAEIKESDLIGDDSSVAGDDDSSELRNNDPQRQSMLSQPSHGTQMSDTDLSMGEAKPAPPPKSLLKTVNQVITTTRLLSAHQSMMQNTTPVERLNSCVLKMATSLQRFCRQLCSDGLSKVVQTTELTVSDEVENVLLRALLTQFVIFLECHENTESGSNIVIDKLRLVLDDYRATKVRSWTEAKKELLSQGLTASDTDLSMGGNKTCTTVKITP